MAESHPCLISIGLKEDKKVQDEAIRTKKYTTKEQDLLLFTTRDDPFLLQITLLMKPRACEDHERVHAMSFASDLPLQCLHLGWYSAALSKSHNFGGSVDGNSGRLVPGKCMSGRHADFGCSQESRSFRVRIFDAAPCR